MSGKIMDVFSLRDTVVGEYSRFATSFTTSYTMGVNLESLIADVALEPGTADTFRADGAPLSLFKHQEHAIALASQDESYVVTTGTGSGNSTCFVIPTVNAVLAGKRTRTSPRTRTLGWGWP